MERTHGKLRTGLSDRLCRNDSDRVSNVAFLVRCEIRAVAFCADAVLAAAGQYRTDLDAGVSGGYDFFGKLFCNQRVAIRKQLARFGISDFFRGVTSGNPCFQRNDRPLLFCIAVFNSGNFDIVLRAAVAFPDNDFLADVNKTPCQITGVGRSQSRIRKRLSGAVAGNEKLQNVKSLTEICLDRDFNRFSRGIRHQSAHSGELFDLVDVASGSGVAHHVNRIVFAHVLLQDCSELFNRFSPRFNDVVIALLLRDQASSVLLHDFVNKLIGFFDELLFLRRNDNILDSYGNRALCRVFITQRFDFVEYDGRFRKTVNLDAFVEDFPERALLYELINFKRKHVFPLCPVNKAEILRDGVVENQLSDRRVEPLRNRAALKLAEPSYDNGGVKIDSACIVRHFRLVIRREHGSVRIIFIFLERQVVAAQNHILRGNRDRLAVFRCKQIVCRQHKDSGLGLRFCRQRNMDGHLVSVKVRIVRRTNKRMKTQRAALHEHRLKRLNSQPVKRRRSVQQNGMLFDNILQNIPDLRPHAIYHFPRALDILRFPIIDELSHYKRLKQLERHFFRKAALIDLQLRSYDDNASAGVIDAFSQQILTESALLSAQHIG